MNLCLVATGEEHRRILAERLHLAVKHKFNTLHILTDDVDQVSFILEVMGIPGFIHKFQKDTFSYFDKIYFTLETAKNTGQPTLYVDVKRINFLELYELTPKRGIQYMRTWGPKMNTAADLIDFETPYFEKGYWNDVVPHLGDASKVLTVLEQMLIINPDIDIDRIIAIMRELEPVFIQASNTKKSVYKQVGNGEGLALSYAAIQTGAHLELLEKVNLI